MNYKEFTGKTVEEAIALGLEELGLTQEQADIRVLEEGKKKLFGSVKARVEIAPLTEEPKTVAPVATGKTDGERTVEFLEGLFEILSSNFSEIIYMLLALLPPSTITSASSDVTYADAAA